MTKLLGIEGYKELFIQKMEKVIDRQSIQILLVEGEEGTGKSALLEELHGLMVEKHPTIPRSLVANVSDVGQTSITQTQQLKVFINTFEKLLNFKAGRAKKRFAYNLGITVLTAIPLIGDIFYAAKEIGRDWEKYQKEQRDESAFSNSMIEDFYAALVKMAEKTPLLIMIDDVHKSDSASIELLDELTSQTEDINNMFFVLSYDKIESEAVPSPFSLWLEKALQKEQTNIIKLKPFTENLTKKWLETNLENFEGNLEFEKWVFSRTGGNQSILSEYLRYFKKNNPLDANGNFKKEYYDKFLPSDVYDAIKQLGQELTQEEMDLLTTASAEGNEFTIFMLSSLSNINSLTLIRILREIEHKHGLIRPIGPRSRYGEKTTIYTFTKYYYFNFFENLLQYEERIELHSRIAEMLNKKFLSASTPEEKSELIGYIAAHSKEADDSEMTEKILKEAVSIVGADMAGKIAGSLGIAAESVLYDNNEENAGDGTSLEGMNSNSNEKLDLDYGFTTPPDIGIPFDILRHRVATYYNLEKFSDAYKETQKHLRYAEKIYTNAEIVMLLIMQSKTLLELNELDQAIAAMDRAKEFAGEEPQPAVLCLLLNTEALIQENLGNNENAIQLLQEAAKLVMNLQPELKIMTLANIGRLTEEKDSELANRYYEASEAIKNELSLSGLLIRN